MFRFYSKGASSSSHPLDTTLGFGHKLMTTILLLLFYYLISSLLITLILETDFRL